MAWRGDRPPAGAGSPWMVAEGWSSGPDTICLFALPSPATDPGNTAPKVRQSTVRRPTYCCRQRGPREPRPGQHRCLHPPLTLPEAVPASVTAHCLRGHLSCQPRSRLKPEAFLPSDVPKSTRGLFAAPAPAQTHHSRQQGSWASPRKEPWPPGVTLLTHLPAPGDLGSIGA